MGLLLLEFRGLADSVPSPSWQGNYLLFYYWADSYTPFQKISGSLPLMDKIQHM